MWPAPQAAERLKPPVIFLLGENRGGLAVNWQIEKCLQPVHLHLYLCLSLSSYLSICLPVCLSVYRSICIYIQAFTCICIYIYIHTSIYPSICISIILLIYLSVYLSMGVVQNSFIWVDGCLQPSAKVQRASARTVSGFR